VKLVVKKFVGFSYTRWPASSVELPGIEPSAEIAVSCGNAEIQYAKVPETT
jgi:hypothetical protein